jgi:ribosomal protein L11 methyltransferase
MAISFVEVTIEAGQEDLDNLVGILSQLGFEGFWEEGETLRCYIYAHRWNDSLRDEMERVVRLAVPASGPKTPALTVQTLQDRNWNELWEKTIQPIRVTDRIVIAPSWHPVPPEPGQIVLIIDPKMSFGTGYHETTRLTLRLLQRYVAPGMHVLDIGTGTGILAIAALRLGASSAVGVDIDNWSYENARENAERNGVAGTFRVVHGSLSDTGKILFHLIAANIQRDIIEGMIGEMCTRLTPDGTLLISGILLTEKDLVLRSLTAQGLVVHAILEEHEWCAFALRKGTP